MFPKAVTDEFRNSAGCKVLFPGVDEIIDELGETTIKLADGKEHRFRTVIVKGAYGYGIAQYCDDCQPKSEYDFRTATIVWIPDTISFAFSRR